MEGFADLLFGLFPFIFVGAIIYTIFFEMIPLLQIKRAHRELARWVDNTSVTTFIHNVERLLRVPNKPTAWNTLRASFDLIVYTEGVKPELKEQVRRTLLAKGVRVGR